MLVLTRKQGQEIHIGQDIVVKVIKTGSTVKVGIDAPASIRVLRGELESAGTVDLVAARRASA